MKLALNYESAQALREMAELIPASMRKIKEGTLKVADIYQSLSDGLGAHSEDICNLVMHIKNANTSANEAFGVLVPRLQETADKIDAYVRSTFSVAVDPVRTDLYYGAGSHVADYLDFRQNVDAYTYTETQQSVTGFVSAREIEGLGLWKQEVENHENFWSQYEDPEMARQVMETQVGQIRTISKLLQTGENPELLASDPELGNAYCNFFQNPVCAAQVGDFLVFQGEERARLFAAQTMGADIPVCITGEYHCSEPVLKLKR